MKPTNHLCNAGHSASQMITVLSPNEKLLGLFKKVESERKKINLAKKWARDKTRATTSS